MTIIEFQTELLVGSLQSLGSCMEVIGCSKVIGVEGGAAGLGDHITKANTPTALFDAVHPVVTFRFRQVSTEPGSRLLWHRIHHDIDEYH